MALSNARNVNSDFPYRWKLSDLPEPNGLKVFSTFACGGGSSMGYKLAGFEVIGANDIDPDMAMIYKKNHHPKYYYLEDIRGFNKRTDLPKELFNLDILDGSPPCSVFSTAGGREKGWNKKKVFREGQAEQTLDDLFFHFINTAALLKPKIVVSENVSGLVKGNAKGYVLDIIEGFSKAGYDTQIFLLDSSTMGVPQKRQRVFFISRRKDLGLPKIVLSFNYRPIPFGEVRDERGAPLETSWEKKHLSHRIASDLNIGDVIMRTEGRVSAFNWGFCHDDKVRNTITATVHDYRFFDGLRCTDHDYSICSTFPEDYDYCGLVVKYVCGMCVPPVMMANVAREIRNQWLLKK